MNLLGKPHNIFPHPVARGERRRSSCCVLVCPDILAACQYRAICLKSAVVERPAASMVTGSRLTTTMRLIVSSEFNFICRPQARVLRLIALMCSSFFWLTLSRALKTRCPGHRDMLCHHQSFHSSVAPPIYQIAFRSNQHVASPSQVSHLCALVFLCRAHLYAARAWQGSHQFGQLLISILFHSSV